MALVIQCPQCSRRYQVAAQHAGKQVQCLQCGGAFVAQAASPKQNQTPVAPSPSLADVDLSALPAATAPNPLHTYAPHPARVSNPSGGPTDFQMRLVCGVMLVAGLLLGLGSLAIARTQGFVYLAPVFFAPVALMLGIAGLISPDVVRAVGKYGGHLSWPYKAAGYGALTLSFVLMALLGVWLAVSGFEPERPGHPGGRRKPGLTRTQTATVMERIRASHASSPNAQVVRKVSFPVFAVHGANPELDAERTLAPVAGYVGGSFRLSADRKQLSFQYKGEKEIAPQYAILLPGPTGIYLRFEPQFEE